jgi:hypothetical protein
MAIAGSVTDNREEAWERIAALAAEVAGETMLVGVRSNGTWFGHCGGIEVDAEGPAEAVYAVVEEAQRNAVRRANKATAEAKGAEDQAAGLSDTADLIPGRVL